MKPTRRFSARCGAANLSGWRRTFPPAFFPAMARSASPVPGRLKEFITRPKTVTPTISYREPAVARSAQVFGVGGPGRLGREVPQTFRLAADSAVAKLHVMHFYSARLLFIILVADGPGRKRNHYDDSVIVFRARDFGHALKRALQLGRKRQTDYKNDAGQKVRWTLVEILNLDYVGRTVDGKEVASSLHYRTSRERIPPSRIFHPERSKPEGSF